VVEQGDPHGGGVLAGLPREAGRCDYGGDVCAVHGVAGTAEFLQGRAEAARVQVFLSVIDRLPPAQRTAAAADLFQLMIQNTESIANDSRVGEIRLLESKEPAA
jgi:hypothetical protein